MTSSTSTTDVENTAPTVFNPAEVTYDAFVVSYRKKTAACDFNALCATLEIDVPKEAPELVALKASMATLEAKDYSKYDFDDAEILEIGRRQKVATLMAQFAELQGDSPAFLAITKLAYALFGAGAMPNKAIVSVKGKSGTRGKAEFPADFSGYYNVNISKDRNGYPGSHDFIASGRVYGPMHNAVETAALSIPFDKLGVFSDEGMLLGFVERTASKGGLMATAAAISTVVGISDAVLAWLPSVGVNMASWGSSPSKAILDKASEQVELSAGLVSNGQAVEAKAKKTGSKAQTEPEVAKAKRGGPLRETEASKKARKAKA